MLQKEYVTALAAMLIVALVAAPRPAEASRPSTDAGGMQQAQDVGGMRRLTELLHSRDAPEHDSARHLLAAGNPKCPTPYGLCKKQCTNMQSDADNCGACGKVCPNDHECAAGVCKKVTATGPALATFGSKTSKTKCAAPQKKNTPRTACYYDTKCSNNNCGGCGICCPPEAYCLNGKCICPPNYCLCKVNGKLKCLAPGQTCPTTGKLCCKPGYVKCATGCCPPCSDPNAWNTGGLCTTPRGNVCCPTAIPGTRCYGPPNNRQCCPVGYWTGSTTQKCCNKAIGEKPTQCEAAPGDRTPPIICCAGDLPCRFDQNPDPVTNKPKGYSCSSAICPPPSAIDPQCTEATGELTDPPCCCKKCKAPYVPKCPSTNGILDKGCNEAGGKGCGCKCPDNLWTGTKCCAAKKCDKTCCTRSDDVCYTKNGQQACCPKSRWDSKNKVCCAVALCATKSGNVCCGTGTSCKDPSTTVPNDSVCCANSLWTGAPKNQCCSDGDAPTQCPPYKGDPKPPKLCCGPNIECQYNENPDPVTKKPIGYACIGSSCSTIPDHCTDITDFTTDPPCCCTACENGFVPQCPKTASGNLSPTCNEAGGAGCGCKCVSRKTCTAPGGKVTCCAKSTDTCDANGNCCPNGVADGVCCDAGQYSDRCASTSQFKCCPNGQECQFSFVNNSWQKVCCKIGYWDFDNDECCATRICNTKAGPECCESPKKCQFAGSFGQCCTNFAWTGNKCCSGDTPAALTTPCPDGSRICCASSTDVCYTDDDGKNACCPKGRWSDQDGCCPTDRWTGFECCPPTQWNCNGICVGPGTGIACCAHTDCQCEVPTGASIAAECPDPPCCQQYLCCDGQCIQPDDQNCGNCAAEGGTCPENWICVVNNCIDPSNV